jgi:hypothetical protein
MKIKKAANPKKGDLKFVESTGRFTVDNQELKEGDLL